MGETLAARLLVRSGYQLIDRNWRCETGEVDLVARKGGVWHFVEVRTRRGDGCGAPEESLTRAKQARMIAVAEQYLADHGLDDVDWQVDLVAVELDRAGRLVRIEVLENVVVGDRVTGWLRGG